MARRMLDVAFMQRLVLAVSIAVIGCGSSAKKTMPPRVADSGSHRDRLQQPPPVEQNRGDITLSTNTDDDLSWLRPVYFELDSSDLLSETRDTLEHLHEWLAAHPNVKLLTIEGHCDEQGTEEYNIALGQRRAHAITDYLSRLGTDAKRLKPISYGALRPAVDGHDEVAWSKNRRGEFRVGP